MTDEQIDRFVNDLMDEAYARLPDELTNADGGRVFDRLASDAWAAAEVWRGE